MSGCMFATMKNAEALSTTPGPDMPIEVVTIDLWNTLFDNANSEPRNDARRTALFDALRAAGNECDGARFDAVYSGIWNYFDDQWLNFKRTPTSLEMIGEMCSQLGMELEGDARDA